MSNVKTSLSSSPLNALSAQIKQISTQLTSLKSQLKLSKPIPIPEKPGYLHEREDGLKDRYIGYRDNVLADYIYGLYHPDVVFKECLDIKSPSYMPVPTTTFKFRETFTIAPNQFGNFVLYWMPNYLGTSSEILRIHKPQDFNDTTYHSYFSNCYVNRNANLDGNTLLLNDWYAIAFKDVQQDFEKYRLTSACIKVKYTGKVINQSGMFAAAASYVKGVRSVLSVPANDAGTGSWLLPHQTTSNLAQFCDFDNIRQGQWAETCSVVSDPDGITCTYVPTDPLNQVFVDNATTIDAINHHVEWDGSRFISSWQPTNANVSYAICGYGLDTGVSCITVEAYYNYEIIVRQEQFPYFSPRIANSSLLVNKNDITRVKDLVTAEGLISRTRVHDNPSTWTKVRGAFTKAASIANDIIPVIKPLLSMLV